MKIKVFIHARYDEWEKLFTFQVWSMDMSSQANCGTLIQELEVEFDAPPHDVLINGQIEKYREEQKQVRAEAESRVNQLQQRINDMLCIEHKPEPAVADLDDDIPF